MMQRCMRFALANPGICSTFQVAFLLTSIPYFLPHYCLYMANSLSISSLISNTSLSVTLGCWEQNPPPEAQLPPLTYIECKQTIHNIPMGGKALAPVSFGRDPGAGFMVPHVWSFGNCAIEIDVTREDDMASSTFAAIFKRAFDIAVECVIKPPHLGGKGWVGVDEKLKVSIFGVHPEASSPDLIESNGKVSVDTS